MHSKALRAALDPEVMYMSQGIFIVCMEYITWEYVQAILTVNEHEPLSFTLRPVSTNPERPARPQQSISHLWSAIPSIPTSKTCTFPRVIALKTCPLTGPGILGLGKCRLRRQIPCLIKL
jgi:hypothetical protein